MRKRWKVAVYAAVLIGLALAMTLPGSYAPAHASSRTINFLVTLYGWPDNSPAGDAIAYPKGQGLPTIHSSAGGTGTYTDPITFASDRAELPAGTKIYVPYLHRYFIMEDDCTECDQDWVSHGPDGGPGLHHVDLWVGGEGARNSQDVINCEDNLTRNSAQVIVDPPATEPVDSTPLFNSGNDACYDPGSYHAPSGPTRNAAPAPAHQAAATPGRAAARFAAVTGFGCQQDSKAKFTEHGWWTDGLNGFIKVPAGGVRAGGCNGSFDGMPMSGSATQDDPSNYALWTFHTGAITHGFCHIDVYVPDDPDIEHVGGNPAVYEVFNSAGTSGPELGTFGIDQHFNRGRWASRHNWQITGGALTVKLDSRGIDWSGSTQTHAHIAVSAVSVTCV